MTGKRILFIAPQPFFEVRGTPIAVRDMLNVLNNKFEIDLITYPFGIKLNIKNVNHFRCWGLGFRDVAIGPSLKKIILDLSLLIMAIQRILKNKYVVIHAVEEAGIIAVLLKKISQSKFVYDMDSIMSEQVKKKNYRIVESVFLFIEKKIIQHSDLI